MTSERRTNGVGGESLENAVEARLEALKTAVRTISGLNTPDRDRLMQLAEDTKKGVVDLFVQTANQETENYQRHLFRNEALNDLREIARSLAVHSDTIRKQAADCAPVLTTVQAMDNTLRSLFGLFQEIEEIFKPRFEARPFNYSVRDVREDVTSTLEALKLQSLQKGLEFELRFSKAVPELVCTDFSSLSRIVRNVVGNAVKFTKEGKVSVDVSYYGGALEFLVSDTGPGVAAEYRDHIFAPYQQGGTEIQGSHGGAGLGLAVARRLARSLGGDVVLASAQRSQGTTFRIQIKLRPVADDIKGK